jgi:hypothetical protein
VGRHADDVPLADVDDLVVELDASAAGDDDVELFLRLVLVAERRAEARPRLSRPTAPISQFSSRLGKRASMSSGIPNFGATFSCSRMLTIV